jgi:spore germination protein YaaH
MPTTTSFTPAPITPSRDADWADRQLHPVANLGRVLAECEAEVANAMIVSRKQSSATNDEVALVTNAGTDAGYQIAKALLRAGYRVAVTSRYATQLTRILHGYGPTRVIAIAADTADEAQLAELVARVESGFGAPIDLAICAANSRTDLGSPALS